MRTPLNARNLQNLPSGSVFGKLIKKCFEPNSNWLFIGSDYDALEDKTNALITKDPNKLAVYEQGFCGHCMRAQAYFSEQMPDIQTAKEADKCFKIKINGQLLYCKSGDFIVDSSNTKIPVEAYYEEITRQRL